MRHKSMTNKQSEKTLHNSPVPQTKIENLWGKKNTTIIDVRSPGEFEEGSIPGSFNIPLLSDSERKIIGILYKKEGQKSAVDEGYRLLESKNIAFINQFRKFSKNKSLSVICARGGMRSKVVTSALLEMGYNAYQIIGGYKRFRNWNLEQLEGIRIPCLVVLHGRTGVGKTLLLHRLHNSVDLEGIAGHRGSIFGGVGKKFISQKNFEAKLLLCLEKLDLSQPVFIEGESRKIGKICIPSNLFTQMLSGSNIIVSASIETRVSRIVREYVLEQQEVLGELREIIQKLSSNFGKEETRLLLQSFDQGDYSSCLRFMLEKHYDQKYNHFINQLPYIVEVSSDDLNQAISTIVSLDYQKLCSFEI